jgi:neutral ceramidase
MGYAEPSQRGQGIHTRQFSRAFIIQDNTGRRVVYASVEIQGISHAMRRDVKILIFYLLNFF